jgi:hypothetical protein
MESIKPNIEKRFGFLSGSHVLLCDYEVSVQKNRAAEAKCPVLPGRNSLAAISRPV